MGDTIDAANPAHGSRPSPQLEPMHVLDAVNIGETPAEPARSSFRILAIMAGLCSSIFLAALNQTVVATAIPTISKDLGSDAGYAWIGAAYLLANAIAAPIWTKLSDIWGRKAVLLIAVALYAGFSIICALAPRMTVLIAGRALQGTAGGGLVQVVYAVIADLFSMRTRALYLALLQTMWAAAGGLGPLVGGALAEHASWRYIFWINLPIAAIAFIVLAVWLDAYNPKTSMLEGLRVVDWFGIVSLLVFMVALLLGLNFGGTVFPWSSPAVICLLVGGALVAAVFILCEKRARLPLVPLDIFASMSNVGALIVGFTHDWVVFSVEYYLPLYFQAVKGASPLESGYRIVPITVTQAVVGLCAGIIVHKTGRYLELIWAGVILLTLGNGLYIQIDVSSSLGSIVAFQLVAAVGAGLLFQPPLIALQALVPAQKTATATATLGLFRNLSTSIAIVVGQVIFSNGMASRRSNLVDQGVPVDLADNISGPSGTSDFDLVGMDKDGEIQLVIKEVYVGSLQGIWILCTCMAACAMVASTFVSRQVLSKVHVEHRTGLQTQGS